jgi:hypothetical protein
VANTLTTILPVLASAMQTVSRERVGCIASVSTNFDQKMAGVGQTIHIPVGPTRSVATFTPGMAATAGTDATALSADLVLSNNQWAGFNLSGEDDRTLLSGGGDVRASWFEQMVAQSIRAVVNAIEVGTATALKQGASRAAGAAGTAPFGTNFSEATAVRRILVDNGAPATDLSLILDTAASANYLQRVTALTLSDAAAGETFRNAILGNTFGMAVRESAGIALHTKGAGTSYVTSGSTAVGVADIALVTGSGTVLTGDVVAFAADINNKYVINTGVAAPGTITIGRPGARVTIATANAMTIGNNYTANVALYKGAAVLAVRPAAIPVGGQVDDYSVVTDPVSGLSLGFARLVGDGMVTYRVHAVWQAKVVNPEQVAILMG